MMKVNLSDIRNYCNLRIYFDRLSSLIELSTLMLADLKQYSVADGTANDFAMEL